ncbi:MAG: sulfate ABC transporter substrate-binding protein [Anaerolineae bacterium]|nr:sulfate ABC transporter substrate-binding protein [Anaerolineae bacterium]
MRKWFIVVSLLLLAVSSVAQAQSNEVKLTLAAFAVPREAYGKIIPLFQAYWLEETGQTVIFEESYLASGAQSRAVIGGFEADIVALSLEEHITRIADAGLITTAWQDNEYNGMVSTSVAILLVRPDNPAGVTDWADIVGRGLSVITPNPATSGGAQWNAMAAYGAAYRGFVDGYSAGEEGALQFLTAVYTDVLVMDADGRESFLTFERGIGDVAITYENEYYAAVNAGNGDLYEIVYPKSTILIENPIAVVDVYADKHGVREVAEAFVAFTYTPEAQAIFAESGFRPPYERVITPSETEGEADVLTLVPTIELDEERFPPIEDLFTIDEFGGWKEVVPNFFGEDGIFTKMIAEIQG